MQPKALARLLALAILLPTTLGVVTAVRIDPPTDHVVFGVSGPELEADGYDVIDDYGTFATARLLDEDVDVLRADGLVVRPLDHRTGRGAYLSDYANGNANVPLDLRADADEPYAIVQFRGPVKDAWRDAVDAHAQLVVGYLPHDAFLVRVDAAGRTALSTTPGVRLVEPWHPAFRMPVGEMPTGQVDLFVVAARDADPAVLSAALTAAGGTVVGTSLTPDDLVAHVRADASRVDDLARVRHVVTLEPAPGPLTSDNAASSSMTQGGPGGLYPVHDRGVDGSTQKAAVCDTGVANVVLEESPTGHDVLRFEHEMYDDVADGRVRFNDHTALLPSGLPPHRKVDLYYSPLEDGQGEGIGAYHGTHTAGTLAGDAPPYGARNGHDGVAFNAKLVLCDHSSPADTHFRDYTRFFQPAEERGAQVHSNSYRMEPSTWGQSNRYGVYSRQHDAFTWDHPQFLVFRSTGNHHPLERISAEPLAKNVVAVGNVRNDGASDEMAHDSVGGVLPDGRIRPTLVAPGDCLMSAQIGTTSGYYCLNGTSMSTPTAAGAAVLVRDYFAKGFYPSGAANPADALAPSAALVRGVLMVSGVEIAGDRGLATFPNKAQGWGRIHLEDALHFAGDAKRLAVHDDTFGLLTGQTFERQLLVQAGQPLRVMLAWSDYPALPDANPALVNDLDLEVVGPDGARVGNAFVGSEVPPGQGAPDNRSVEEGVYVASPQAGAYTVRVRATHVPLGPQPFALAATGDAAWA